MNSKLLLKKFYILEITILTLVAIFLPVFDLRFKDYSWQINNLLASGSFYENGRLIDRYPPLTAILYSFLIKYFVFLDVKTKLVLFHSFLFYTIILCSDKILRLFNISLNSLKAKGLVSLVVFNPYYLSFYFRGVNSELIYTALTMFSLYFSVIFTKNKKSSSLAITAFLIGLSILTRVQGVAIAIALFAGVLLYMSSKWKSVLLTWGAVLFLTLSPWQYLVFKQGNHFISSGGIPSFKDGLTFNQKSHRQKIWLPERVNDFSEMFYSKYYNAEHKAVQDNPVLFVAKKISSDPVLGLQLYSIKFFRCFFGTDSQKKPLEISNMVLSLLLLGLYFGIVVFRPTEIDDFKKLNLIFLIYFGILVMMSMIVLSIVRYQAVAFPIFWLLIVMKLKIANKSEGAIHVD